MFWYLIFIIKYVNLALAIIINLKIGEIPNPTSCYWTLNATTMFRVLCNHSWVLKYRRSITNYQNSDHNSHNNDESISHFCKRRDNWVFKWTQAEVSVQHRQRWQCQGVRLWTIWGKFDRWVPCTPPFWPVKVNDSLHWVPLNHWWPFEWFNHVLTWLSLLVKLLNEFSMYSRPFWFAWGKFDKTVFNYI